MGIEFPLVSAIMPTSGRVDMAREALRMFRAQTWPNKELVIVDDRDNPSFAEPVSAPDVLYLKCDPLVIGEKRNIAVQVARAQIIMTWDSDDKYRSDRMEHQARLLIDKGVDMVGYHVMEFEDIDFGGRFEYKCSPDTPIGVSQCYWKRVWEAMPFRKINEMEDLHFVRDRRRMSIFCCEADGRIIARIHNGNTSDKRPHMTNTAQWRPIA